MSGDEDTETGRAPGAGEPPPASGAADRGGGAASGAADRGGGAASGAAGPGAAAAPPGGAGPAAPDEAERRLPPVGLGDLVDVVAALDLHGDQIATAAELLRLRPRAVAAAASPVRRVPVLPPRPRTPPDATGAAEPAPPSTAEPEPSLPVVAVETPAERTAAPLARRSLAELFPERPGLAPTLEGLFTPATRRALLRGVTSVRTRDGDVDVDAVVEMLAGNRALDTIPLEWVDTTRGEVMLLLDTGAAMDPFRADVDRLPGELARIVGEDGLKLRWFEDAPTEVMGPLDAEPVPFHLPAASTRVLAVTAFGVRGGLGAPPGIARTWRRLVAACVRRDIPLLVLTPLPARRRPPGVPAVTWDRGTSVRDVRRAAR